MLWRYAAVATEISSSSWISFPFLVFLSHQNAFEMAARDPSAERMVIPLLALNNIIVVCIIASIIVVV